MEDNEKKNDNMTDIVEQPAESTNGDTNLSTKNDVSLEPNLSATNYETSTNDISNLQSTETTSGNEIEKNVDQQQIPSSSTEIIGQCSDERIEENIIENCTPLNSANDSTSLTITANTNSESVLTNINELNNDVCDDLASSSRLLVEKESDRRTETILNDKLDKSEIRNELATVDSSEVIDGSINVMHSNGSNSVSDKVEIVIADTMSSNNETGGANNCIEEVSINKDATENNSKMENYKSHSSTPPMASAISSSSIADSTENDEIENDVKINENPSSSIETLKENIHSEDDNTPSVHSIINDKGGGTESKNITFLSTQQLSNTNEMVLNKPVDSINSSLDAKEHTVSESVEAYDSKDVRIDKFSDTGICLANRTEDKCDPIHSSIVENQVACSGSVIKPTNLIVTHIKGNDETIRDVDRGSTIVHSERLPHIELPKSIMDGTNASNINPATDLKAKSPAVVNTSNNSMNETPSANLSLDLTQPTALLSRQNSLYVSNPDFSRQKATTKDLSPLRMKPPDFSKLSQAYTTNHLKIPNPNFTEMDVPPKQPTVNPANFAEISKRFNYISDLQLKNATPPHNSSIDRTLESNRNLSNLYVKAPDFSGQKKNIPHDIADEPTAHVIHKNPYLNQVDKSNKSLSSDDPSIIYQSYPQLSQDVTMSIVPTHNAPYSQPHQQPLAQRQNFVEQPQTTDQRYKPNYPVEVHKNHQDIYRSSLPNPQHPYENRIPDASFTSHSKATNISYKQKPDVANAPNMYQRENVRAAVIQSGKPSTDSENYNHKLQPNYGPRNDIPVGYYEKPSPKPIGTNPHIDYMQSQQQQLSNTRYSSDFNDRIPTNKSNYDRTGYTDQQIPSLYQEHYNKQANSLKPANLPSNAPMAAPPNHPLRSPIMHSKPIDIPTGHMNPPQHWPSHSPRITQSPISLSSSPLSGRVTQSPAGASPSPQHHIIHAPSALPAHSPTYRYNSPHQPSTPSPYNVVTTASSSIQFKDAANPAMFQKPPKSKSSKPAKANSSQPINSNYYYLPPESAPYPGHQYSMKLEQPAHYPPHQYSAKTDNNVRDDPRSKQTKSKTFHEYVDLTKMSSKPAEIPQSQMLNMLGPESRYDPRYLNERHEFHQNHRQETVSNKHNIAPESSRGTDKHAYNSQQKTIMDPYAYRKASEADLNYEIIKKTLNKDISIRRSDADLSCSIFDNPKLTQTKNAMYPTSNNEQYYQRASTYQPNFNYHQAPAESSVRRDSKSVQIPDSNRYYPAPPPQPVVKASNSELEHPSRGRSYSVESSSRSASELKKHDLSVTVSRISAAIAQPIERARLQHSETTIPITHQPSTARNQQSNSQPTRAKTDSQQTSVNLPQKPSSTMKSVLTPVKRESPLDLSVKTVKTKADSTGDDYAPSSSRDYNAPLSLKVDFAPNFQKHSRVSDKNTANQSQVRYENQMPTNSQYSGIQRHQIPERNQNIPHRSAEKVLDARYHNQNMHPSHGSSTYLHSQPPMNVPSSQNRSLPVPNDPFKHQAKPVVLSSPALPTVFGRKPEELKNLPINPEIQEYKSSANVMQIGSYENVQGRSKGQPLKSNYHPRAPEHLLNSHHPSRPQEMPVKYPDFKTNAEINHVKTIQHTPLPPLPPPVDSTRERPSYGFGPGEKSDKYHNMNSNYVGQPYQEQRSSLPRSQTNNSMRSIEEMTSGHPYFPRKRPAEQSTHDQYPKVKQMRREEPPIQHPHYYNMDKTRYPVADPKKPERYQIPVEKVEYNQKYIGNSYQREHVESKYASVEQMQSVNSEQRDTINPVTVPIRENLSQDYNKQRQYHQYPEQIYNAPEIRPSTHAPVISYPTEQHQKHLAYQKSKKEAYKQLPSPPPSQQLPPHNYYQREPHDTYNVDSYQSLKPELKGYPNEPNYGAPSSNQQYPKQDSNQPQQIYQEQWPQNQQTLQPDSSKPYYPPSESIARNYVEYNQPIHPVQSSSVCDLVVRPIHRTNPIDAPPRHGTALKGADQNVISKLRTNLEMKEIEKQKLLRNQSSTETVEDENQKSDIASLIAARIRTKGELKGFTPIPVIEAKPVVIEPIPCDIEHDKQFPQSNAVRDSCSDADNSSALDLLDWGSACNDFVEQLQGGAGFKKRGRRRRAKSSLIDMEFETVGQEIPLQNLPGTDYKCDIDEDLVNIVKAENKSHQSVDESLNNTFKEDDSSSSDEDKPLLFLRQKSLSEMGKLKTVHDEDTVTESACASKELFPNDKTERTTVLAKLSEKIAKNKKGQQREKRENEKRISIATSSESDDEISSKVNKRSKKSVRKPRTRSSVGYKNTSDDETSDNGSKNSKRKNDHTKRKKRGKSSSDSEPIKQRKKVPKIESDEKSDSEADTNETPIVKLIQIKQEVISDDGESDSKIDLVKNSGKRESELALNVKIEETMTRSKRKQELERQKANSKILRNDKMIKNVSIPERKTCESKRITEKNSPKSKFKASGSKDDNKRKSDDCDNGESSKNESPKKKGTRIASVQSISSDSDESEVEVEVSLRLRTRSAKSMDQRTPEKSKSNVEKVVEKKWSRNTPQKKNAKETTNKTPPIQQYPPGWENEVYAFKRSLKIPASLITIKRPAWYRKSISLPDLDPHSSDTSETFSEKKQIFLKPLSELSDRRTLKKDSKRGRPANSNNANDKVTLEVQEKIPVDLRSKSIIDLLHQKIIHPLSKQSKKIRLLPSNESKILPQTNEVELLSTPGAENVFKHQSVFETAVITSRTRKEYRVQKNQEIIREVFGCDDRPASAPPLNGKTVAPAITFDQKYKQYLEKMNMEFGDNKLSKYEIKPDVSIVKQEKIDEDSLLNQDDETQDTEINECERNALDIKEEPLDCNERDTPSVSEREGITPSSFSLIRKRGRGARGGRRKGSSGFDYIRKKKKPIPQSIGTEGAPLQQKRRAAAINYLQEKDENDINREIRGWVLNKGVGETVLHKAARLGYIDVIAFCLERLEMNPDQKDNAGYTALHEACSRGQLDIARLLLEYGANHSETAVLGGIRPLHEAVENGCIEIVRLLLSYGADPLLATYSGQTPIMLAESDDQMIAFLKNYLHDIQNTGPNKMPWRFEGAWKSYDSDDYGYDVFDDIPSDYTEIKPNRQNNLPTTETNPSTPIDSIIDDAKQIQTNKCDSNSNIMLLKNAHKRSSSNSNTLPPSDNHRNIKSKYKNLSPCTVVLKNLTEKSNVKANGSSKPTSPSCTNVSQMSDINAEPPEIIEFSDDESDAEFFEIEESQAPHVPLYHLRDEGAVKWALLSDLCYMLKVKSKDTLLKQICPSSPPSSGSNKELLRELKMGDFLERATCLQLLCAGEKLNIRSSKVILVKYNDSVKNLLGVKTLLMKM